MKLRTRLLLVLVLAAALLGGSVYGGVELYKEQLVEQERADVEDVASLTANQIDGVVAEKADTLGYMASKPEAREFDEAGSFLRAFLQTSRFFAVQLVDANGTVRQFHGDVTETQRRAVIGSNVADEAHIRAALDGDLYIAPPQRADGSERAVVVMSAPVYNRSTVVGALSAGIYADTSTLLGPVEATRDESQAVVVSSDGMVLHERTQRFDEELSASATVPSTGWQVTVVRDVTPTNRLIDDLRTFQGIGVAVVLLLVAAFGRWEYQTTLNQTEALLDGFERVRDGDFESKVSLTASEEWREISEGFNELVEAIASHEAELEERRQRLEVLNRVLRHNVRNSTSVILGYAELSRDSDAGDTQQLSTIETHAKQLLRLSETARRLQGVIDSDESMTERIDVATAVDELVDELRTAYPDATVTASVERTADALANPQLGLAIDELCRNTLQHNRNADRRVDIDVRTTTADGEEVVEVTVADNGPGIPTDQLSVLESGRETPLEHGEGLGLWLVYWTAKRSGGDLRFAEGDDGGAVVTLVVPRAEPDDTGESPKAEESVAK